MQHLVDSLAYTFRRLGPDDREQNLVVQTEVDVMEPRLGCSSETDVSAQHGWTDYLISDHDGELAVSGVNEKGPVPRARL